VTAFSPQWVPPVAAAPYAGQCTKAQIADAYANCFATGATIAGCMQWEGANLDCLHCMVTDSTATRYGPVLFYLNGGLTVLNIADCIALAEPCNQPCAEAILADTECDFASCDGASSPCTGSPNSDIVSCIGEADSTCGCTGYHASYGCYSELLVHPASHPAVQLCALDAPGSFAEPSFTAVVTFMCGPPA
jgi:hypothetical protein